MAKHPPKVKLNPELLTWAISASGYKHEYIASKLGIDALELASWESGEDSPTFAQLEDFARLLSRPLAAFFLPSPPEEPARPRDFRLMAGRPPGEYDPDTLLAFRRARNLQAAAVDLARVLGVELAFRLPRITTRDDPEAKAAEIRQLLSVNVAEQRGWRDSGVALHMWRSALFDVGVLVFQLPIPLSDARGFCMMGEGVATIAVSTKDSVEARIFSLFHDLCHLCLRAPGVSGTGISRELADTREARVEEFCDRFAAGVLVPLSSEWVCAQLDCAANSLPDETEIVRLARELKVSKYVVLRRMLDTGRVGNALYWDLFNKWQELGRIASAKKKAAGGPHVVDRSLSERGRRVASLVLEAYDSGRISAHEAGQYLSLGPKWLDRARENLFLDTASGQA